MKGLKSLQIKAEAYLKPKRAYMTKLFMKIVNDLLFSQKIFIIDARLGSKEVSENKKNFKAKPRWSKLSWLIQRAAFFTDFDFRT